MSDDFPVVLMLFALVISVNGHAICIGALLRKIISLLDEKK